ncbi:hypothetical protein GCM10011379_50810 [Filimonas zeae]|uniref:Capsule assembly Wzi family protein n=1 Tax=Filimonas zeae TaxID=1737353 RepID=A0A917J2R9_9BACT|nr:hypothetical protein GCM10011379_50810 [Filimonas zeae]
MLDRLDIKLKNDPVISFTTIKPYNRQKITARIELLDSLKQAGALTTPLSRVDYYNMKRLLLDNSEWTSSNLDSFALKRPVFKVFYKTPGSMYAINTPDFILRVDPLLNLQYGSANDGTGNIYVNTRGLRVRGSIGKKVGFYTVVSDNQEKSPLYVRNYTNKYYAVPGEGFFKDFKDGGVDYFGTAGGISFNLSKYFDFQLAYDKLFIGNGYRSLFLSNTSANYAFARLNLRLSKFNYETVIAQTVGRFRTTAFVERPTNFMLLHHLSMQVSKWLNVGLYENVIETGESGLKFSYINPVILYSTIDKQLGSTGKSSIGLDFKANPAKNIQFYGQLLINEFVTEEILRYSRGSWKNKQAAQLGFKYIDAFKINNLDIQLEGNWIRPYTYMDRDSITNFMHYNQPLAHPMGANLKEFLAIVKAQPLPRLYLQGKLIYYLQGLDSAGLNFGGDLQKGYEYNRPSEYGLFVGSGVPAKCLMLGFNASYELFENMFLDFNSTYRNYNIRNQPKSNVFFYSIGLRINLQRRDFDF